MNINPNTIVAMLAYSMTLCLATLLAAAYLAKKLQESQLRFEQMQRDFDAYSRVLTRHSEAQLATDSQLQSLSRNTEALLEWNLHRDSRSQSTHQFESYVADDVTRVGFESSESSESEDEQELLKLLRIAHSSAGESATIESS